MHRAKGTHLWLAAQPPFHPLKLATHQDGASLSPWPSPRATRLCVC